MRAATHYSNTLQHAATTHCNTRQLQPSVAYCNTLYDALQHTAGAIISATRTSFLSCHALQHTATHCSTLQHTATHCNTLQYTAGARMREKRTLIPLSAIHCNTLQYTATYCNSLQHTATHCNTLQHTATHCRCNDECEEDPRDADEVVCLSLCLSFHLSHRCFCLYFRL